MHQSGEPVLRKERLKEGRAITFEGPVTIFLPDGYRRADILALTPPGQKGKHGKAPMKENR